MKHEPNSTAVRAAIKKAVDTGLAAADGATFKLTEAGKNKRAGKKATKKSTTAKSAIKKSTKAKKSATGTQVGLHEAVTTCGSYLTGVMCCACRVSQSLQQPRKQSRQVLLKHVPRNLPPVPLPPAPSPNQLVCQFVYTIRRAVCTTHANVSVVCNGAAPAKKSVTKKATTTKKAASAKKSSGVQGVYILPCTNQSTPLNADRMCLIDIW